MITKVKLEIIEEKRKLKLKLNSQRKTRLYIVLLALLCSALLCKTWLMLFVPPIEASFRFWWTHNKIMIVAVISKAKTRAESSFAFAFASRLVNVQYLQTCKIDEIWVFSFIEQRKSLLVCQVWVELGLSTTRQRELAFAEQRRALLFMFTVCQDFCPDAIANANKWRFLPSINKQSPDKDRNKAKFALSAAKRYALKIKESLRNALSTASNNCATSACKRALLLRACELNWFGFGSWFG